MSIYMPDAAKQILESQQIIQEVYFGETPEIQELQKLVTVIRSKLTMLNVVKANSMPEVLELSRKIEKMFGFRVFTLNILPDRTFNAFTMPVSNRLDIINPGKKLEVSDKGFKFKSNNIYCVSTYITSGLIMRKEFTDREILAILLHEVGHSFTTAYTNNSLIGSAYKVLLLAALLEEIIINVVVNKELDIAKFSSAVWSINAIEFVLSPIDNAIRKNVLLTTLIQSINFGYTFIGNLIKEVFVGINNVVKTLAIFNPIFIGYNIIMRLLSTGIINKLAAIPSFRNEQLSDNFATAYGYGADLSSALNKMTFSDHGYMTNKIYRSVPVFKQLGDVTESVMSFVLHPISSHPETVARTLNQIDMLEAELNRSDMDKKMVSAIKEDLVDLRKALNVSTDITNLDDPDFILKSYNLWMADNFGGDFRNALFTYLGAQSYNLLDKTYQDKRPSK